MRRAVLLKVMFAALVLQSGAGCHGDAGTASAVEAQAPKPPLGKGTPAQNLTNAYLVAQAKLALDDFAGARSTFASIRTAAQAPALPVAAELRKQLETAAVDGTAAPDIAGLRTVFARLGDGLLVWFKTQPNPLAEPLTIAHCPMALDGKGARWLQLGKQLKNPYFGSEMLACGTIESTLMPNKTL